MTNNYWIVIELIYLPFLVTRWRQATIKRTAFPASCIVKGKR